MAKICIDRPSEIFHSRNPYQIYIDDKKVGTIGNGESQYFEVEQGEHKVVAKMSFFMGSPEVLVAVKGDEVKRLKGNSIRGVIGLMGIAAVVFGLIYTIEPSSVINQYSYIIYPGLFLLDLLTIGRKKYLSLTLEG